jgi:FkbM family methyltransferase
MIEALEEKRPILTAAVAELGNADCFFSLLGEKDIDNVPFFVVDRKVRPELVTTGSSKYRENADFPMEERSLAQHTLETVLSASGFQFQLIKLDVQGADLEVLAGLGRRLSMIEVILTEMSLVEYNKGAPLIDAVLRELNQIGFVLYDIVEEHRFGGKLFQIDGLFVRPSSRFRPQPPFWK